MIGCFLLGLVMCYLSLSTGKCVVPYPGRYLIFLS